MCVDALVIKLLERFKFIITMVVSDGENHVAVLLKTGFKPEIISVSPLLLHDCTDMKSIFLYLVCKKGNPFTKKIFLIPLCGGYWLWELVRVSSIFFVMIWCPLNGLELDDGYLWSVDGFF